MRYMFKLCLLNRSEKLLVQDQSLDTWESVKRSMNVAAAFVWFVPAFRRDGLSLSA